MRPVFIMVKCNLGKSYEVAACALEEIGQVSEIYSISGQYDLLIKAYLENDEDTGHFINDKIHLLPDVRDTFTLITFKAFS